MVITKTKESEGRRGKWRLMAIGSFAALVETEGRMEGGPDGHQVQGRGLELLKQERERGMEAA